MNNLFRAFQNVLQSSLTIHENCANVEVVTVCNQGLCCLGCDSVTEHHIPDEWKLQVPDALKDFSVFIFRDSQQKVAVQGDLGTLYTYRWYDWWKDKVSDKPMGGNDVHWTLPQCTGKDAHSRKMVRYECYVTWWQSWKGGVGGLVTWYSKDCGAWLNDNGRRNKNG